MDNVLDSVINFFSPTTGLKRRQARFANDAIGRNYDVASKSRRNNGWGRLQTTAAEEVSKAFRISAGAAQDLTRNNPLARRIKKVWSSNIVGGGIQLEATGESPFKEKKFNSVWDEWAESVACDFEGHHNLYGLQNLWVETIVESGGVLIRQHIDAKSEFPLQLQTIEQSFLDSSKNGINDKTTLIDGIQYDSSGRVEGYWILQEKTQTGLGKPPVSKFHKAENIIHIFKKDRAGQHLGITWFSTIATTLRNYDTYQDAKLMQQQIAACFALIVEGAESGSGISGDGSSDFPDSIEPAMIEHVKAGQTVTTVTPPKADSSSNFDISIKRDIASGVDLTYEQLTGDYSLVNFASGRMGKSEFFNVLDVHQKVMMKPALDRIFNWFSVLYQIKNGRSKFKADWTFPVRAAVNPKEELDVVMAKVRHGMLSPSKAAKGFGEKLPEIMGQWKKDKELFGELPFDIDPSVFASTGNQLDDNDAASSNNNNKDESEEDKAKKKSNGEEDE